MNCANHPDIAPMAYCRTCGKPLCANCTRDVKGVIYCENCLAERLQGVQPAAVLPAAGFVSSASAPIVPATGPNPAVAGILAGFFPGMGSVYAGQYAKGLAHMGIFILIILGIIHLSGVVFGIAIGFFYVYQIIDAVRSARAIQMGEPAPDPFGLAQAFGTGETRTYAGEAVVEGGGDRGKIPTAAVILIGLGLLFLLQTTANFDFGVERTLSLVLIGLGIWLFAVRWGLVGTRYRGDRYSRNCRTRGLVGPVVLVTLGAQFLVDSFGGPDFGRTWPILLLAIGMTMLLQRKVPPPPTTPPTLPGTGPTGTTSDVQVPPSEVRNG